MENGAPKMDATGAVVMQNKMDAAGNPVPEMKDGKPIPFILSYAADQATTMAPVDTDHPKDLTPHFQFHPTRRLGRRAARVLARVHPGLHRDPDPGRLRVGHVDG